MRVIFGWKMIHKNITIRKVLKMSFYVRATGNNRYSGGTDKWLKIRNIKKEIFAYILEVRIRGQRKFVAIRKNEATENLEFGMGTWPDIQPISHLRMIEELK